MVGCAIHDLRAERDGKTLLTSLKPSSPARRSLKFLRLQPFGEILKSFVWVGRQGPNVYATKDTLRRNVVVVELFKEKSKLFTRGSMIIFRSVFKLELGDADRDDGAN